MQVFLKLFIALSRSPGRFFNFSGPRHRHGDFASPTCGGSGTRNRSSRFAWSRHLHPRNWFRH
jgi:hypothetical protein